MDHQKIALAKFFKDSEGKVVLWQVPNTPLIGWALFMILARVVPSGSWQGLMGYISFGFIFTWAWLEITQGTTYFRRAFGLVVLIASICSRFK